MAMCKKINKEADLPTLWFAVLERARLTNDFERAAQAQSELKRLGVSVKYIRRTSNGSVKGERE